MRKTVRGCSCHAHRARRGDDARSGHTGRRRTANREVTGPFAGTVVLDFLSGGCNLIHLSFDGSYESAKRGTGSFHLDVSRLFGGGGSGDAVGTFDVTTPRGAHLSGDLAGTFDTSGPDPSNLPFAFTLTVHGGHEGSKRTTGTILINGTWQFVSNPSPTSGALTGSLDR